MKNKAGLFYMLAAAAFFSAGAVELDMTFAPEEFNLSSDIDTLVIKTNVSYYYIDSWQLDIGNKTMVQNVSLPDSNETFRVHCSKAVLKEATGDFDSLSTETPVKLTIYCDGIIYSVTKALRIKK